MALLKYVFHKDEEERFKVVTSTSESTTRVTGEDSAKDSSIKMELLHKVKDVDPDGTGTIQVTIEKGPPAPDGSKQSYLMKMTPTGKILDLGDSNIQNTASLPDHDVSEGSSWSHRTALELPGVPKPVPYKNTYTLDNFEKIGNYDCAIITMKSEKIKVEIDVPDFPDLKVPQTIESEGTIYFAYNEGKLIKSATTTFTTSELPDGHMETERRIKVELIQ